MNRKLTIAALLLAIAATTASAGDKVTICAQNLQNFFWSTNTPRTTDNSIWNSNYTNAAGRARKASLITDALAPVKADIYAFNELEAKPEILEYLAQKFTEKTGITYLPIEDGIDYEYDPDDPNTSQGVIKSGYLYRPDRVKPYGNSYSTAVGYTYVYPYTMRIQTFETVASGERFALSVNHFKAGGEADDQEKRVGNASALLQGLKYALDPDILIVGDLNCEVGETAIDMIVEAGYEEQLLRFSSDPYIYSHCWDGGSLIDHVLANPSMAAQVTGAEVRNECSPCSIGYDYSYSDHDPYVVTLDLQAPEFECENIVHSETFYESLGSFTAFNLVGTNDWFVNKSTHYAVANGYSSGDNDDWLVSPGFDLRQKSAATIEFEHCAGYGTQANWPKNCHVLISSDYLDDPEAATWTDLNVTNFGSKYWDWQSIKLDVPDEFLGKERVVVAFHYKVATGDIPAWEIKNFVFSAECDDTGVESIAADKDQQRKAQKLYDDGQVILRLPDGRRYDAQGRRLP